MSKEFEDAYLFTSTNFKRAILDNIVLAREYFTKALFSEGEEIEQYYHKGNRVYADALYKAYRYGSLPDDIKKELDLLDKLFLRAQDYMLETLYMGYEESEESSEELPLSE